MFGAPENSYSPLQVYHLDRPGINCVREKPAEALQKHIYYYWLLRIKVSTFDLEVIPDNSVDLVMSPELENFSTLYFPVAENFTIPLQGPIVYIGTCFKVTQLECCLGCELATLKSLEPGSATSERLHLTGVIDRIQGCQQLAEITPILDTFWQSRINSDSLGNTKAGMALNHQRWLEVIEQSLGQHGLGTIAAQLGLSERQFRRVSTQLFGLSPKKIQRVQRLQSAMHELISADSLGIENHYYDDSHRIKELKKLTGLTPGEIRRMAEIYNQAR